MPRKRTALLYSRPANSHSRKGRGVRKLKRIPAKRTVSAKTISQRVKLGKRQRSGPGGVWRGRWGGEFCAHPWRSLGPAKNTCRCHGCSKLPNPHTDCANATVDLRVGCERPSPHLVERHIGRRIPHWRGMRGAIQPKIKRPRQDSNARLTI